MGAERPEENPKSLWREQPTEPLLLTEHRIQQKASELRAKARQTLLRGAAVSLGTTAVAVAGIRVGGATSLRAGFALAAIWSLAGQYFITRGTWPETAGQATSLLSYREEVERLRSIAARTLVGFLAPLLLTITLLTVLIAQLGTRQRGLPLSGALFRMLPFLFVLTGWIVGVALAKIREQRTLRQELEQVEQMEEANG